MNDPTVDAFMANLGAGGTFEVNRPAFKALLMAWIAVV